MQTTSKLLVSLLAGVPLSAGQKTEVTVIDRQDSALRYAYALPGSSTTNTGADIGCVGVANTVNCSGSARSTTSTMPPRTISYDVIGATLSLKLPDGRIAIVNCNGKLNLTDFSRMNQALRSCRVPLTSKLEAEFDGNKAKLRWPVSVDGKKFESETYRIIAVADK